MVRRYSIISIKTIVLLVIKQRLRERMCVSLEKIWKVGNFGKIENATIAVISKNIELITIGIPKMVENRYMTLYDVIIQLFNYSIYI